MDTVLSCKWSPTSQEELLPARLHVIEVDKTTVCHLYICFCIMYLTPIPVSRNITQCFMAQTHDAMEPHPSLEAASHSATQEIPNI